MPTTEIAIFPLSADSDIGDPSNIAAKSLEANFSILTRQAGFQQVLFGMQIEHPANVEVIVTWDSIKSHHDFMAGPDYPSVIGTVKDIVAGQGQVHHVDFKPEGAAVKAFSAPVTEVATFYFEGAPGPSTLENMLKFCVRVGEEGVTGFLGATTGLTHEEIEKDGAKGIGAVIALGWHSVDAHMQFRKSELFKELAGLFPGDAKQVEMHHTVFMKYLPKKGSSSL